MNAAAAPQSCGRKRDLGIAPGLRPATHWLAVAAEARLHRDLRGADGGAVSGNAHPSRSARQHAPGRRKYILSGTRAFKRSRRSAARRAVVSRPARARDLMAVRCGVSMGWIYRHGAGPAI